jgi:chemotaxis protein histidine kinase CheA
MPQARRSASSPSKPAGTKAAAKPAAARSAAAKPAAAKPATSRAAASKASAAKPAAAKSASSKAAAAKPAAAKSAAAKSAAKPAAAKPAASKSSPRVSIRVNAENVQLDAIAERLRKLNEKIIDFGREAGENTLTSYEKALKTIASGLSQGPAKDEIEWITHLAASQAKFVREITDSWAKAARDRLK